MARKSFDKDFKLEAVKMVISQQRPVTAVARELGIHENTLYKWINQANGTSQDPFPGFTLAQSLLFDRANVFANGYTVAAVS